MAEHRTYIAGLICISRCVLLLSFFFCTSTPHCSSTYPCSGHPPQVGGPAKSQLVHEVDALGGEIGRMADRCYLQKRVLNKSKVGAGAAGGSPAELRQPCCAAQGAGRGLCGWRVHRSQEKAHAAGELCWGPHDPALCRHRRRRAPPCGRCARRPTRWSTARRCGACWSRRPTCTCARVGGWVGGWDLSPTTTTCPGCWLRCAPRPAWVLRAALGSAATASWPAL